MKLILFDVNGTLVNRFKIGEESFQYGIKMIFGIDTKLPGPEFSGWTDKGIIFELLKKSGLSREIVEKKMDEIFKNMVNYVKMNIDRDKNFGLLPNVKKLLDKLSEENIVGLLTGNLEGIAKIKMQKLGLWYYFKVGSFGSYSEKRSDLVPIAIKQAKEKLKIELKKNDVFVVGDTPQDIETGKVNGVKTIAVCTGFYKKDELKKCKPDYIFDDLTDSEEFLRIVNKS